MNNRRRGGVAASTVAMVILCVTALWAADPWKVKKYTEWSEQEAMQVLRNSPWASTESIPFEVGSRGGSGYPDAGARPGQQQTDDSRVMVDYTVAWYSALPIREAHARLASMRKIVTEEQVKEFLQPVGDICQITVTSRNQKPLMNADIPQLLKKTYLQVKGKEKINATDYKPPSAQSRLAIFQFPRTVNGTPLLTEADKDVEFVTDLGEFKVRSHFIPKKMMIEGALVY